KKDFLLGEIATCAKLAKARRHAYHVRVETEDDIETLQARLVALQSEHRDLDAVIAQLSAAAQIDELLLRRMKKRKLQIKDKISAAERLLSPDELA
ncbi:MAG TPA: YdcH family protein, partial [Rhodocyclaceae bacterium]|nr:YdcH family protein [Rhodocyclaceae bacterium]